MSGGDVILVQYDVPPLEAGEYSVTVTQTATAKGTLDGDHTQSWPQSKRFAVAGPRFALDPADVGAAFPPDLANGEYAGVLPHVAFTHTTLPWQRTSVANQPGTPWLAVLLFDDGEMPKPQALSAKYLIPTGQAITVSGSTVKGVGALPDKYASYPGINPLDYGQSPDDPCTVIDVPTDVFSRIAPTTADLQYLGHIREMDPTGGVDAADVTSRSAIVLGNRVPLAGQQAHAALVALEHMGPLLPADDGTPSPELAGVTCVRLIAFKTWTFTAGDMGETLLGLLRALNQPPPTGQTRRLTTLQVPFAGDRPDQPQVDQALADQAAGKLTEAGATVLVHNGLALGYVPLAHRLRRAGGTVSWYRGPCAPLPVRATVAVPLASADAASRYDPQTGMFDISYSAAWQLGQLLALQSGTFSLAVANWRRSTHTAEAVTAEQERVAGLLGDALVSLGGRRVARVAELDTGPPPDVVKWLARLSRLEGVPFNYLVPDERMLPAESLRFFHLDNAWITALLDGALAVGRTTTADVRRDAVYADGLHAQAVVAARELRANRRPGGAQPGAEGAVTGFLLRSQAVAGWPRLEATGFSDQDANDELPILRMARITSDVMLCLFDGVVEVVGIHEAPEQLHCGVEGPLRGFTTTLRQVKGSVPGKQYDKDPKTGLPAVASVPARGADPQTLRIAAAAAEIEGLLVSDYGEPLTIADFTSAELALELIKGVVDVEFRRT